jgi:hypothetical protein
VRVPGSLSGKAAASRPTRCSCEGGAPAWSLPGSGCKTVKDSEISALGCARKPGLKHRLGRRVRAVPCEARGPSGGICHRLWC